MGIVNIIATASIALSNIVQPIGIESMINTNTNTKTEITKEFAQEAQIENEEAIEMEEIVIKTEDEIKNDRMLAKWKTKQEVKWANLPKEKFTVNASAYTAAADETGGSGKGITASGIKVEEKRTLACAPEFPFGTIIEIETMGQFRCEDRGGAIKGNKVDIYMETKAEAFKFGRRNLVAWVVSQ